MTAILNLIYCWLVDMLSKLTDIALNAWDSVLGPADAILASIGTGGLTAPAIPTQYTWILGATGMAQAVGIIAAAMLVRFTLQSVPFVRWGS